MWKSGQLKAPSRMYDSKIMSADAGLRHARERIEPLFDMVTMIADCAGTTVSTATGADGIQLEAGVVADRYARAGSVVQRRVDALVRQAGVESSVGCGLLVRRPDASANGTAAAALFLHGRMQDALRKIDHLLPRVARTPSPQA